MYITYFPIIKPNIKEEKLTALWPATLNRNQVIRFLYRLEYRFNVKWSYWSQINHFTFNTCYHENQKYILIHNPTLNIL